jgi:hypothetical protein
MLPLFFYQQESVNTKFTTDKILNVVKLRSWYKMKYKSSKGNMMRGV